MPPDPQQQQQTKRNDAIVAAALATLAPLWKRVDWQSPQAPAAIKTVVHAVTTHYGAAAAASAAQFYDALRADAGMPGHYQATVADPVPLAQIERIVDSAFYAASSLPIFDEKPAAPRTSGLTITDLDEPDNHGGHVSVTGDHDHVDLDDRVMPATTSQMPVEQRVPARINAKLQRLVLQPGRDTIAINVEADPSKPMGWARVPTSDHPCAFCIMLASRNLSIKKKRVGRGIEGHTEFTIRGPYMTKESATRVVGRGRAMSDPVAAFRDGRDGQLGWRVPKKGHRWVAGGVKGRGSQQLGDKYHDHCSCIAVPVFKMLPPSVDDHKAMYDKAVEDAGTASDVKKVLASMRKIYPHVH